MDKPEMMLVPKEKVEYLRNHAGEMFESQEDGMFKAGARAGIELALYILGLYDAGENKTAPHAPDLAGREGGK